MKLGDENNISIDRKKIATFPFPMSYRMCKKK